MHIFSKDIGYKSSLSLDEYVETCDPFILLNGPLRSFEHGVLKEIPLLAVNPRRAEQRQKAYQSKLSSFLQLKLSSQDNKFLFMLQQASHRHVKNHSQDTPWPSQNPRENTACIFLFFPSDFNLPGI